MQTNRSSIAASLILHAGAAMLLFTIVSAPTLTKPLGASHTPLRIDLRPYRTLRTPPGGGGGERDLLPASKGRLPKPSPRIFTPPMVLTHAREPILLVEPALAVVPDMPAVSLPQWGDPLSKSTIPSGGPGSGGGIGPGHNGGVGPGDGPGAGPGPRPGSGGAGTAFSQISAPVVLYQVEPEFSEEARRAKHYGTVVLIVDVDTTGHAVNIRVAQSLGLGLDEKAVDAVSRWKFRPGRKDGRAVTIPARIEVNFHLL